MLRLGIGILLIIAGTIWILQGLDLAFAPQSFMTDNRSWALWGALAAVSGGGLVWLELNSRRP